MRAPGSKHFHWSSEAYWFSEADWAAIKQSLADGGVDLDATKVGEFVPGKWWWQADERFSLRDALQYIACYFTVFPHKKPPTAAQVARDWQKVAKLQNACYEQLACSEYDGSYTDDDWTADGIAAEAILRHVDELKGRIAKRQAMPSSRAENARTRHNDYWRELTRLWRGITDNAGPLRRKKLSKFLVACTPPGLFADMTERQLKQRIDGFISNYSRKKTLRRAESRAV